VADREIPVWALALMFFVMGLSAVGISRYAQCRDRNPDAHPLYCLTGIP
jgi:hypothetical protein